MMKSKTTILLYKGKRQYLLTLQILRYRLLASHISIVIYNYNTDDNISCFMAYKVICFCLYFRPHQINFMDDGCSAEKNGASKQNFIFSKTNLISPKNGANEEATIFF